MNLLKIHPQPLFFFHFPKTTSSHQPKLPLQFTSSSSTTLFHSLSLFKPSFKLSCISQAKTSFLNNEEEKQGISVSNTLSEFDDLAPDGVVYQKTLRLVECSMFAAVTGLVYFLSNSLSIEVATAMLLLVLSGPVKALAYLLTHGLLGFTMGSLWRRGTNWGLSIFLCTIARSTGAMGYIMTSSFLIRENILALITINIHASLTFIFSATGVNIIPSMNVIYAIFGTLVLLNSGFFVFLLHLLYTVFLTRLGMRPSLRLPGWLEKAL
ncbi:uncharacterized protein LOC116132115 isoform X2 [Pistacia vera]|uniref:uncharacterized protein LOC116132115 isoform X2 n=1 Tax=Pistacia vera TaxID=55513 RepID=UPI001262BC5F|nr:uncharacterized protein LOC116132115 isoform X2 [Pistacia vera]